MAEADGANSDHPLKARAPSEVASIDKLQQLLCPIDRFSMQPEKSPQAGGKEEVGSICGAVVSKGPIQRCAHVF